MTLDTLCVLSQVWSSRTNYLINWQLSYMSDDYKGTPRIFSFDVLAVSHSDGDIFREIEQTYGVFPERPTWGPDSIDPPDDDGDQTDAGEEIAGAQTTAVAVWAAAFATLRVVRPHQVVFRV